jgi:hypothetical protein
MCCLDLRARFRKGSAHTLTGELERFEPLIKSELARGFGRDQFLEDNKDQQERADHDLSPPRKSAAAHHSANLCRTQEYGSTSARH